VSDPMRSPWAEGRSAPGKNVAAGAGARESGAAPYAAPAASALRRNYALGVANGALMTLAHTFEDPRTIMCIFVLRLTSSDTMVGLVTGIFMAGWYLPQFLVSSLIQHKERVLPYYVLWAKVRIVSRVILVLAIFLIGGSHPTLLFWVFLAFWTATSVGAGFAGVPFLEIVAKTVPERRRGGFFGMRRIIGAALGVVAGLAAKYVLAPEFPLGFPANYGLLMTFAAISAGIAVFSFCMIEEPSSRVSSLRRPFMEYMRSGVALIGTDPNYRQFLITRVLWSATAMAFPFYAVYAVADLGMEESAAGIFATLWVAGSVAGNLVWSQVIDRHGSRAALVGSGALAIASPLLACIVALLPDGALAGFASGRGSLAGDAMGVRQVLIMSTFIINAFAFHGRAVSNMTYLLEIAPAEKRLAYIGLVNTLTFPLAMSPVLGGLLAGFTSYFWMFAAAAVVGAVGLRSVLLLDRGGLGRGASIELGVVNR
jgi:MFS family permease